MKALLAVVLVLVAIYLVSTTSTESTPPDNSSTTPPPVAAAVAAAPVDSRRLEVVSFQCGQNSAYYSAAITVRNLTTSEVSFPKVFVQFTPESGSPFTDSVNISPRHLPADAMGDATLISRDEDGQRYDCAILRIQDSNGARVD